MCEQAAETLVGRWSSFSHFLGMFSGFFTPQMKTLLDLDLPGGLACDSIPSQFAAVLAPTLWANGA
jgi:hypothetical protein